jgi:hypothetical protein
MNNNVYTIYMYMHILHRPAYAHFMTNSSTLSVDSELKLHYLNTLTALGSGLYINMNFMGTHVYLYVAYI